MAAANSKSMKATLMAAGDAWDCTSDTVEGEEALVRYAELKGQRVDDAGVEVERVRETTRDFENRGLEFTVEATAREAGECDFHSYLTGVGGVALARANTTGALAVGRNSVPLRFSAETMALVMAEDRGPWTVTTVAVDRMTEEGGKVGFFTNLVPCISGDYSGRACVSSVFHLAGKCQDRLQNRSVVVSVPLGMPCEGDRVLHVGLATKEDGLPFAISTVSNYFGKGVTTVDFTFTPKMMSAAKTDGPYFVVELAVDPMGIEGGTALAIRHKTQAYAFADVTDGRPVVAIDVSKAGLSPYWLGSKDNRREHNCIGFDFWVPVVNRDREVSHNVLLEAVFADAKGMELAVASDQVNVGAAAEKNASLRFPINEIVDSGSLGPFTVIRASLRDAESGEILDSCGAVDVWTDEYAEGELKAIEPPFVDEEMAYVDVLASSNGSRLSGICLTVPVVTKYNDTVIGTAELYGGDGTRLGLGMVSATPDEAEEGLQIVFDGDVISNSSNDGPYEIRNLSVYVSEAPEARHVSERVYETAAFRHEDFVSPSFDYATFPNGIGTFSAKKKHAYDGIVVAPGGTCVGTIRITTAVAKKSGVSAATAKITLFGQKAVAFSGKASKGGKATLSAKGVPTACTLSLGSLGFEGHWGPYAIFGSRDDYSTKGSAAARELAKGVKGAWTLLARSTCLLLVVDAKGGVKITGRDGGGHSVASTSRVIRGDGFVYIPVNIAETKKTDACHALIRIDGVLGEVSVLDGEGLQMDSEPSCSKTEKPRFDSVPSRFDAMVGGSFSADFEVNDFCYPYLFSAKNLPKGLAIDKKTGRIAGVPSAAGTKNVRVTATSLYNKKWKSSVDFKIVVAPIPDEFVGAFSGVISDPTISDGNLHDNGVGTFSVTVAKTGKISGKVYYEGKTSTFSAASFDSPRLVGGEWRTSISADIFCAGVRGWFNWIFKQRDGFVENVDGARLREYGGHSDWACSLPDLDTMEYSLYRNVWKDKNATRALNEWSGEYVAVTRGGDGLSLVLDGAGVVKFAGTLADGRVVSASTPLIALNGDRFVWLVLPADGSKGWERVSECFHLQNAPGTPEPGKVACRKPGVRLSKTYGGSVTMSPAYGQVEIGQSVKLTAKASKGYVFLGWFEEESVEPVSQKTTYYSVHAGADRKLTARFMKESEVRKLRPDFFWNATTRFPVGIVYEAQPSAHGVSLVKVKSVTKLPKGLVWKKGKVSGVPTVAKKSTAMVTVALSSNAKIQWTYKIPLTVSPLPGWTVGTFSGDAGKVTVSSVGKISAKIKQGGTNWTFTANSYVAMEVMEGVTNLLAEGRMKHTYEDGKKKKHTIAKSVEFVVQPPSTEGLWDSSITGLTDMGEFTVWRSIWGDEPTKRYLTLNGCVGVYSYPVLVDGEELGVLSLKVSDTGKLTIAGRLRPPTDQLTGIPEGVVENLDRKISVTTSLRYDVTKGVYVEYAIPSTTVTAKVSAKRGKSTITTKYTVTFPAVVIWKEILRERVCGLSGISPVFDPLKRPHP